jgi:hypothetical protein
LPHARVRQHGKRAVHVDAQRRAARVVEACAFAGSIADVVVIGRNVLIAIAEELFLALARIGEERVGGDPVEPCGELRILAKRLEVR